MVRRKKPRRPVTEPDSPTAAPAAVGTAMGELLRQAGLARVPGANASKRDDEPGERPGRSEKPAAAVPPTDDPPRPTAARGPERPRSPLSTAELTAWNDAYRGVVPLRRSRPSAPQAASLADGAPGEAASREEAAAERAARERLSALVAGGVRFVVRWDEEYVLGTREGLDRDRLERRLIGRGFAAEAQLDLHGERRADVGLVVDRFVRTQHRRGRRYLLLIVGKGLHSEGGRGVLAEAVVEALTGGGAAPVVAGFASSHPRLGGTGAIAVALS